MDRHRLLPAPLLLPLLLPLRLPAACSPTSPASPPPAVGPAPAPAAPVDLRFRPPAGTRVRMEMITDQQIGLRMEGTAQKVEQVLGFEFTLEVLEVLPDHRSRARLTFDRTRMRIRNPVGEIVFDSAAPPALVPLPFRGVAFLAGKSMECRFAADGGAESVAGMDALLDSTPPDASLPEGAQRDALALQAKRQFGDEAMREMVGGLHTGFAGRPVAVGESWTWQRRLRAVMPMAIDVTSTLLRREGGRCLIGIEGRISPHEGAAPTDLGPMTLRSALSGTVRGSVEVEESTGLPLEAALRQDVEGTLVLDLPGVARESNPVIIVSSTSLKRVE